MHEPRTGREVLKFPPLKRLSDPAGATAMASVNVHKVVVLDNPTAFTNPIQFEISFECVKELKEGAPPPRCGPRPRAARCGPRSAKHATQSVMWRMRRSINALPPAQTWSGRWSMWAAPSPTDMTRSWILCWSDPSRWASASLCSRYARVWADRRGPGAGRHASTRPRTGRPRSAQSPKHSPRGYSGPPALGRRRRERVPRTRAGHRRAESAGRASP